MIINVGGLLSFFAFLDLSHCHKIGYSPAAHGGWSLPMGWVHYVFKAVTSGNFLGYIYGYLSDFDQIKRGILLIQTSIIAHMTFLRIWGLLIP